MSTWELTVHWLMWPVYCHGNSIPVDIPDCLLWPCRRAPCEMWLGQTWPARLLATDQHMKHTKLAQVNCYVHSIHMIKCIVSLYVFDIHSFHSLLPDKSFNLSVYTVLTTKAVGHLDVHSSCLSLDSYTLHISGGWLALGRCKNSNHVQPPTPDH